MNQARLSPTSALVAHAESLISGGRILVVGPADSALSEHLLERGARLVQVLDPDPKRVAQAAAHNSERLVSFSQLNESSFRDSSYDCVIVEDLASANQPRELLRGLKRALSAQGVAIIACSSDETSSGLLGVQRGELRFSQFSESVHATFEQVLLVAQTPFVGYAVVHLDLDAPPEPALDNGFLTGSADGADFYVAIAGRTEVIDALDFEDMTIVQFPATRALENGNAAQRATEQRSKRRIEALETEVRELRARGDSEEIERLTAELEKRDSWIRQLESRAESADTRADDAEATLERNEEELRALRERLQGEEQRASREDFEALRERLAEAERQAARSQKELRWAEERVTKLGQELEGAWTAVETQGRATEDARALDQKRAEDEKARADRLGQQLQLREKDIERLEKRVNAQEHELIEVGHHLADAEDRFQESELDLDRARDEIERIEAELEKRRGPSAEEVTAEIGALEDKLQERGRAVRELEAELARLQTYAQTLVAELALRPIQPEEPVTTNPEQLREELARLEKSLAEREADLLAATWTIGTLEKRLGASENRS